MRGPLRRPGFRRLLVGKLISQTGDWLTAAALIGWLYSQTGSTGQVALLLLARLVPPILGSGIAAAIVDRVSKRRLLVTIELGRGLLVAGALVAIVAGVRPLVFAAVAGSGALAALSAAATPTLVPALLPVSQYEAANAALGLAENVAMATGAAAAGIALASIGLRPALAVDVVSFIVAAVVFVTIPATAGAGQAVRSTGFRDALGFVVHRRSILALVAAFAVATAATGLANATLPRFLESGFGLGAGGYGFGFAALAVGLAIGEGSMGFVRVGESAGRWIGGGLAAMAGLFCLLAFVDHAPTALLLLAAIGFVDGTTDIVFDTAVQREADARYHGAVFGVASACFRTTMTLSVVAAPAVNGLLEPGRVLLVTAALLAVASVTTVTRWARTVTLVHPTDTQPGIAR